MFFNNEKLRGAGETVEMTEEEIKEYLKTIYTQNLVIYHLKI